MYQSQLKLSYTDPYCICVYSVCMCACFLWHFSASVKLILMFDAKKKQQKNNQKPATEDTRHECLRSTAVPMFSGMTRCQRLTHPHTLTHKHTHGRAYDCQQWQMSWQSGSLEAWLWLLSCRALTHDVSAYITHMSH